MVGNNDDNAGASGSGRPADLNQLSGSQSVEALPDSGPHSPAKPCDVNGLNLHKLFPPQQTTLLSDTLRIQIKERQESPQRSNEQSHGADPSIEHQNERNDAEEYIPQQQNDHYRDESVNLPELQPTHVSSFGSPLSPHSPQQSAPQYIHVPTRNRVSNSNNYSDSRGSGQSLPYHVPPGKLNRDINKLLPPELGALFHAQGADQLFLDKIRVEKERKRNTLSLPPVKDAAPAPNSIETWYETDPNNSSHHLASHRRFNFAHMFKSTS